jgi:hypothetical protein
MILWSSTQYAIDAALTAAGLEGYAWQVEEGRVYEIMEFTLYNTIRTLAFEDPHKKSACHGAMYGETGYNNMTFDKASNIWVGGTNSNVGNWQKEKETKELKPYYDHGEIIWNKCCMCGRWLRVTRIGMDDVCSMCEDVYLENKKAEGLGGEGKKDEVTKVEFTAEDKSIGLSGLCDYCGMKEADFHVPALQGIVCAECMAIVDAELCSNYEVKLIRHVSEEIQPLKLEEGVAAQVQEMQLCDGTWSYEYNA